MPMLEAKEILDRLKERYGTFAQISVISGLRRSTLVRIYYGHTSKPHDRTLGILYKLLLALNA